MFGIRLSGLLVAVACASAASGAMMRGSQGISLQFDPADTSRSRAGTASVRDLGNDVELDPPDLDALPWTLGDRGNQQLPLDFSQTKAGQQGSGGADSFPQELPGLSDEEIVLSQFGENTVEPPVGTSLEPSGSVAALIPEGGIGDVPEPSSILLIGGSLLGLAYFRSIRGS